MDDDQICSMVISKFLNSWDIQHEIVFNGLDAVNKVRSIYLEENRNLDLILMDWNMPVMNGPEAINAINKMIREKKIPFVPIIALTANTLAEQHSIVKNKEVVDYLWKPVKKKNLLEKLNSLWRTSYQI